MSEKQPINKYIEALNNIVGMDIGYLDNSDEHVNTIVELIKRVAELEDLIEQGTLVQLDEKLIGQEVIGIHKRTDGIYYLDFDENIVIGFTSKGVVTWNNNHGYNDYFENGYYFANTEKGKAEAEAKLANIWRIQNDKRTNYQTN